MDDRRIIELYFARDERAIEETKYSYGKLIRSVAMNILGSSSESEECESDTYVRAWNSIPPSNPKHLSAYLTKIVRNLSLNRLRDNKRHKLSEAELIYDEISEAIPESQGDITEDIELREAINSFIGGLDSVKRRIFVKRYFYMKSVGEIAREMLMSAGGVKSSLSRMRVSLRKYLLERGIVI